MHKVYSETLVLDIHNVKESKLWLFFLKIACLLFLIVPIHYIRGVINENEHIETNLALPQKFVSECDFKIALVRQEMEQLKLKLLEMNSESDEIGLFDYAAEYAGGRIISTLETKSYPTTRKVRVLGAFDLLFNSKPEALLRPSNYPGECYAFYGTQGRIIIELGKPVIVTEVSLQHIRFKGGGVDLTSAPKDFKVWGSSSSTRDNEWTLLGSFMYDLNHGIIQSFPTILHNRTTKILKLEVLSNHGNREFTCVYRFRAHSAYLYL